MTTNLPLIRLTAINPLFLELKRRGVDVGPLLHDHGLPTDVPVSPDLFVASDTVYELVEKCADLSGDRFFGFAVGSLLDLPKWDPIADATARATTIGELLTMFAVNAGEHSTATKFYISTEGERSTFGFERVKTPPIVPAQNDASYMGLHTGQRRGLSNRQRRQIRRPDFISLCLAVRAIRTFALPLDFREGAV